MCDGTLLPHCGHLLSCAACQRFAAFRVRNRIFEVLRFGTPIEAIRKAGNQEKTTEGATILVYPTRSNQIPASHPALRF
jgi:hypothetical protein